eukprot:CAMPEP_0201648286 /NCGR_PEP_ID=MMETSP0493-20130528/37350_1 /ASSEMBLY_ACC=CAM_ASM_000838 /TAXON_ID=420259 /ORGANISM="Thalassiosira gravida, Strain GMp14c1" /LENGTH=52 /DNA_ID=CAMNT_0048123893 /DNA_START=202 /DNA_END=360 /DNA_ORIENTATION=-
MTSRLMFFFFFFSGFCLFFGGSDETAFAADLFLDDDFLPFPDVDAVLLVKVM